ncbi:MAG: DUF4261 domain-containing protein [Myxococcaceae bacterium]|jgi:hypothetical protein|nr:DUF4261 domain-containing protein [Myxococcaceae bacterium]
MGRSLVRVILFVPGSPPSLSGWKLALRGLSIDGERLEGVGPRVDLEWVANDGHFGEAFSFGTVPAREVKRIDQAPGALVLSCHVDLLEGRAALVAMVERLRDAGALAVRLEQSKLGWLVDDWLAHFQADDAWSWHRGAVTFLRGDDALQSIGMHAFSRPDVWLPLDEPNEALQQLGSTLNVYQLEEDPTLLSGHTFRPDEATPRRRLERWPALEYPEGHPCHNPYGVWRFGQKGSTAREHTGAFNFMPALRAVLEAAAKQGPLDEARVLALRDAASVVAVEPRMLLTLERQRGYADLDPELVWEQWSALHPSG